jgi:glycosyltransferase involved in cell wall biosynthesis
VACIYEHQVRMVCALAKRWRGAGAGWSGLYLHAHAFHFPGRLAPGVKRRWPVTRALRDRGLRGLLMLDEGMAPRVQQELGIPVMVAPDPADAVRGVDEPLVGQARARAEGRPVVGVFGHLLPSKGVATLARCAIDPGSAQVAFWFVGAIHWPMFDAEEAGLLKRLAAGERQNVWLNDARIPDEAGYNALVAACDVLFAAYRDFPHSSNTLAKAAIFEKPVIVSEGHLMARRVREFRLGLVVPQDDPAASLAAIQRLCADPAGWAAQTKPRWSEYRELHSPTRLRAVLGDFFGSRDPDPDQR